MLVVLNIIVSLAILVMPIVLVVSQPDLGTSILIAEWTYRIVVSRIKY